MELAVEQIKIGNRPGKGFKAEGWKNIINGFKEKTGITDDQAQFKKLVRQASWILASLERPDKQHWYGL